MALLPVPCESLHTARNHGVIYHYKSHFTVLNSLCFESQRALPAKATASSPKLTVLTLINARSIADKQYRRALRHLK